MIINSRPVRNDILARKMGTGKLMKDESDIIREMVEKKKAGRKGGKGRKGKGDGKKKSETLPQHKHCIVCYRAISLDKNYCSTECEDTHQTKIKKQKRMMYMLYGLMAILFVGVFLFSR